MKDVTVRCVCGSDMRPLATQGRGHFRCSSSACRNRVHVDIPGLDEDPGRCRFTSGNKRCDLRVVDGLRSCRSHAEYLVSAVMRDPELREFAANLLGETEYSARIEAARESHRLRLEENHRRLQVMRPDCPVVCYVRLSPDNIKIGTTIHLPSRMDGLRVLHRDQVLAAEPGGLKLENRRHRQFAHLRYHKKREDFRPADDLLAHVEEVREEHGDPYELAARMLADARRELAESSDHHYSVIN